MNDLTLRTNGGLNNLRNFDPRPNQFQQKPEYNDYFRNIWLNSSASNLPIRQLYSPANIYAVANDHDYLEKSPEAIFLEKLQITTITEAERVSVEMKTRGQSKNKSWREERLLRLQASNHGRICKATDRTDFKKLVNQCGIFVSSTAPYVGCSPDGLVGSDGIVEVKCPYTARNKKITPQTVPYLSNNEDGKLTLDSGHDYYYQVMGTLLCTGRQWCDFVVWTFEDSVTIRISRDDQFIENMLRKLSSFFNEHF